MRYACGRNVSVAPLGGQCALPDDAWRSGGWGFHLSLRSFSRKQSLQYSKVYINTPALFLDVCS